MNIRKRRSDRCGRAPLPSPGRPPLAGREARRRFWAGIAAGVASEDAAVAAGVSQAVGTRWFREAGGMPPAMFGLSAKPLSGRYLSFAEREEIALLRVQGYTIREIARRLARAASTISRELRRNAATRGGGLEYRATTAPWHAERTARRPKQAKLRVQGGIANLCGGTAGWHRRRSGRGSCSRPGGVLERPAAWTAPGPAVGKRLEPRADCPALAGRLPG